MADKRIDQLTAATSLGDSDLLVVEQESAAKKATGTVVSNYINSKFGLTGMASDISTLQTAVAGKQDALTLPLPIAKGGTNAATAGNARINLGLGTAATADIDDTLSIQGDAADSATVAKVIFSDTNAVSLWASGAISSSTGTNVSGSTRIRTIGYIGKGVKKVSAVSGYKYILFAYEDGTYIGTWNGTSFSKSGNWRTTETNLINLPDYDYRIVLATSSDGTIGINSALNLSLTSVTDTTLMVDGCAADAKVTGELRDIIYSENAVDIMGFGAGSDGTSSGVSYTFNSDGSCTIAGTSTGLSFANVISSTGAVPIYVKPGRRYYLNTHGATGKVGLRVTYYTPSATYIIYHASAEIVIPDNITGILIRYEVESGVTVSETVHYTLTSVPESSPSLSVISDVDEISQATQKTENAINKSMTFGFWEQGTLNVYTGRRNESSGSDASTTRIRTAVYVGLENSQFSANALNNYTFTVWKYNLDETFIGTLREDGSFQTGSGATRVTSYSFEAGYLYKLVLFAPDITSRITPIEGTNVSFTVGSWLTKYKDVKIAFLGDSIIAGRLGDVAAGVGTRPSYTIPQRVEQELGVFTFNYAVGGMGWIGDTSGASRGNAYGLIQTLDLSGYTHVVLSFGANDGAFPIGAIDDTSATTSTSTSSGGTIIGNIYGVLDYIHTTWPELQVILISPFMNKHGSFPTWGWAASTTAGWTWAQLSSKMDEVAERYHLQLIHGDRALNSWLVGDYIGSETDSIHPVEQGYNLIGRYIAGQLATFL